MRLVIASNNAHKIKEIKAILGGFFTDIVSLREAGIDIDVVEDGDTFEANARKKAEEVLMASDFDAALSDDSGLVVDALGGAPGIYSARYAGEEHDDEKNKAKLLVDMENVPDEKRTCRFVCCIALARRGRETVTVRGTAEGLLTREFHGEGGFGYDPMFFFPQFGKTFAELPADVKNTVSHRHNALMALCNALEAER